MDPRIQRTIDALLQAARQIFGERAAEEVTVEEIAERAHVAVGSIYNHFGSKAALHAAVVERALDSDREYMNRAYIADLSPDQQILAASEEYLQFYLDYPDYFRMLAFPSDPGQYPAGRALAERLARRVDEQNARLADALGRGIATGTIRSVDVDDAATLLWAAWNGIISLAWRPDALRCDEARLRELILSATDVVIQGLLPRE
jgi:TetR/AcrR family transcriptional regulator